MTGALIKELSRAFFSDSGSTAVEIALKAAWLCWIRRGQDQRKLFVSLEGGYHGDTCGAMAVSDPMLKTLTIVGDEDEFAPDAELSELFGDLPNAELHVISGVDHFFGGSGLRDLAQLARSALG